MRFNKNKGIVIFSLLLLLIIGTVGVFATREDNRVPSLFTLFSSSGDTNCCYQCNPYTSGTIRVGETKTIDYRSNSVYNRAFVDYMAKGVWYETTAPVTKTATTATGDIYWEVYPCNLQDQTGTVGVDWCVTNSDCSSKGSGYYCDMDSNNYFGTCHLQACTSQCSSSSDVRRVDTTHYQICTRQSNNCFAWGNTLSCPSGKTTNSDGSCVSSGGTGGTTGGDDPPQDEKDTLDRLSKLTIHNLVAVNVDGTTITEIKSGQQVKIVFKIKSSETTYTSYWTQDKDNLLVEAGVIPKEVADAWGFTGESGTYSIINPIRTDSKRDACCKGQPNIEDNLETFATGAIQQIMGTGVDVPFEYTLQVPFKDTTDQCGNTQYWNPKKEYVIYVVVKNGCYKDGFLHGIYLKKDITVNTAVTSTVGSDCSYDAQCHSGEVCIDKKCSTGGAGGAGGEGTATQVSLTEKDLTEATSATIVKSICSVDENCLPYEPASETTETFSVKCKSTALLTQKIDEAVDKECSALSWNYFKGAFGFSTATCGTGLLLSLPVALATAPVTGGTSLLAQAGFIVGCLAVPVATIAVGGGALAYEAGCSISKASAGNGLCIATSSGGGDFLCSLEIYKFTDTCSTNGIITIVLAIVLLFLLSRMFGGGK